MPRLPLSSLPLSAFLLASLGLLGAGCSNVQPDVDDDSSSGEDDDSISDDDSVVDDDTAPDDDTVVDDDTTPPDDDDATPPDDDTTPPDDDDATPPDDDTTPPPHGVEDSCNTWDPVDYTGGYWEYDVFRNFPTVSGFGGDQEWTEQDSAGGDSSWNGHDANAIYSNIITDTGSYSGTYYRACTPLGQVTYGMALTVSTYTVDVADEPGFTYLPAEPDLEVGASWIAAFNQSYYAGYMAIDVYSEMEIVSMSESVTVGAGTFNAMHVYGTWTESETTTTGYIGSWNGEYDAWYARGVGQIKLQRTGDNGDGSGTRTLIDAELMDYGGGLLPL